MKNILLAVALLVGFGFAQPPKFSWAVPTFSSGGGGSGCDSACQAQIGTGEGVLYQPSATAIISIPNGPVGQILTSRGPGLTPEWENPAAIQAFATGSDLVSNPTLTNADARFLQVTAMPGMYDYTLSSFGTANNMRGIAYSGSVYVAVGFGGTIFTSTTGTDSWTARTSGTALDLYNVIWDGTRFLVVGASGVMLNSTDGITWSNITVGSTQFNRICKNNSTLYVAVGQGGGTYYTTGNPTVGANWTIAASGIATDSYAGCVSRNDTIWISGASGIVKSSSNGSAWATRADIGTQMLNMLIYDGTRFVASGAGGTVLTSTNGRTDWAQSTTGTTKSLRVFAGNSRVFAVGDSGVSLESSDNGVTWVAGDSVGTNRFMRFGINDTRTNSWALVVGDSGTLLVGSYPFRSAAYESNADRAANIDTLGWADYPYSETPIPVTIPGQITFNIGLARASDMPFNFDVVTIEDMIYNIFVVQNSSLSPGPYYCYNCVFDFGPDMRFEFGPQSASQYASLFIQNSASGNFYFLKSTAAGNAGQPITWDTVLTLNGTGKISTFGGPVRATVTDSIQYLNNAGATMQAYATRVSTGATAFTAARTLTLSSPATYGKRCWIVYDGGRAVNGANTLTISASVPLDGASTTYVIGSAGGSATVCADPTLNNFSITSTL